MCADKVSFTADAIVVGAGIAGAMIAHELGRKGKRVLILEAGPEIPVDLNSWMDRFYRSSIRLPETPYLPDLNADPSNVNAGRQAASMVQHWRDPSKSYLIQTGDKAFASTYERTAGGTALHWLGTCLRFVPKDFKMAQNYGKSQRDFPSGFVDWPITYDNLERWYRDAEFAIGVAGNTADQAYHGITFPSGPYPMPRIPPSKLDHDLEHLIAGITVDGQALFVRNTPAARNSQPYQNRRVCAGNTNCIPICPVQAKYDPTVTLNAALETGNVKILYRTVAREIVVDRNGIVTGIEYSHYHDDVVGESHRGSATAKVFVLAGNAIETPRLLLMSKNGGRTDKGVANESQAVGKFLMDHPYYLAWGLMPSSVWPYRGPLSTSGIEGGRDGAFRSARGAFRVDIGNDGWALGGGEPYNSAIDFITGRNLAGLNKKGEILSGRDLVKRLNNVLTRQFRLGFLVEQSPDDKNRVTLSDKHVDGLGLPRPAVDYRLSDYTLRGLAQARRTAKQIFNLLNQKMAPADRIDMQELPADDERGPTTVTVESGVRLTYIGAGHMVGTYRMGSNKGQSVVGSELRSWDHKNLFLLGSGVFPTIATANPTLTIAALSLRAANTILNSDLK